MTFALLNVQAHTFRMFETNQTIVSFLCSEDPPNNVRKISIVQMLHSTTSEQNIHIKTSKVLHGDDMK